MLKLIKYNSKFYNLCEILMLPTMSKSNGNVLWIDSLFSNLNFDDCNYYNSIYHKRVKLQHLYVLSDEKIKVGDWFIHKGKWLHKCEYILGDGDLYENDRLYFDFDCKKIIITTDNSLGIITGDKLIDPSTNTKELIGELLPKFSNDFLNNYVEKFNKGITISNVLVEYECDSEDYNNWNPPYPNRPLDEQRVYKLKVDSKDNTITIKEQRDNM